MPSTLPEGEPAPADGSLPEAALAELHGTSEREGQAGDRFGVYVHVPFCVTRCGYCDFNTYTAEELGPGVSRTTYAASVLRELDFAHRVTGTVPVDTVFVGGGTPTLLPARDLVAVLQGIDARWGLAPGAEVTTEANPESVDADALATLRRGGFTRVSLGMQSAVDRVLATLDRRHTPGRVAESVAAARRAGFEHVSVDLIYGTPGETDADWRASLDVAVSLDVDHVSAYSLIVEPGTALARRVSRGELPMPDDDVLADRYLMAEDTLQRNGFTAYEVSNSARDPAGQCRHNLLYWRGGHWWGAGPGAHSHVGGVRWWNVKHPAAWAQRLDAGSSPAAAREQLDPEARRVEDVLLRLRLSEGLPLDVLHPAGLEAAKRHVGDGLLDPTSYDEGRAVLTLRGRLLADAVVRDLVD